MSGTQKKISLFKQKIAQARSQMEVKDNGFPIAPCIVAEKILEKKQQVPQQVIQEHHDEVPHGFLHQFKGDKFIKSEQVQKIESQNWQRINKMSESQRQELVNSLKTQLPNSFLNKLNTKKEKQLPKQSKQNKENFAEPLFDTKENIQNSQLQGQQLQTNAQDVEQTWENLLKINIDKGQFEYTQSKEQHLVSLQKLSLFIGSQNNYSQVVGGQVTSFWGKAVVKNMTTKSRELIVVSGVNLDGRMISQKIASIVVMGLKQIIKTSYTSIFIQLCTFMTETLVNITSLLSQPTKNTISKLLEDILNKLKQKTTINITPQQVNSIKQPIEALLSTLVPLSDQEDLNWRQLKSSISSILQLSLLQEPGFQGYWFKAMCKAENCGDLEQLLQLLQFLFEFVHMLVIRRNKSPYIDLKVHRDRWAPAIDHVIIKFSKSCWNIDPQYMLMSAFLGRFVGGISWQAISSTQHLPGQKGQLICGFLLFNTLSDLKGKTVTEEQIQSLNLVFHWLSDYTSKKAKLINFNYILSTLLQLFLNDEEYYSEVNQQILEQLIQRLVFNNEIKLSENISVEQVKTLLKNYSYCSFGNKAFTVLMFSLAINSNTQVQQMILRQSILPYWKVFYNLKFGKSVINLKRGQNSSYQLKRELLQKIKAELGELQINALILYIS